MNLLLQLYKAVVNPESHQQFSDHLYHEDFTDPDLGACVSTSLQLG